MAATKEIRKRAKRPPRTPSVRLRKSDTGGPGILRKRARGPRLLLRRRRR